MAPVGAISVDHRHPTSIAVSFPANDELAVTEPPDDPGMATIAIAIQANMTLVATIAIAHMTVTVTIARMTVAVLVPIAIADADIDLCQPDGVIRVCW
jgi:hypothetical protein